MARAADTQADRELIAHAKGFGFDVSARALEDWRRAGAMPTRNRIDLGCKGTRYEDPPQAPERLIAVCSFLRKTGAFAERPDLPRRRRVGDALPWLFYEGVVPGDEIRDRVIDYWEGLAKELERARQFAREQEPGIVDYELAVAGADVLAEQLIQHPHARHPRSLFAKHRAELGDEPRAALLDAFSQLMQSMQGPTEVDASLGYLIEHPFIESGMQDAPLDDDPALDKVLRGLIPSVARQAVRDLSEEDWQFVRTFIHTAQGLLISLERHNRDPQLQKLGRIANNMNTTGQLLMLTGFTAAIRADLEEGLAHHAPEEG